MKVVLLHLARALGLFALGRWLTRDAVMIVGWHGVSPSDEHARFPSLFISPESLRSRLAFLSRHYTIVDLETVAQQHATGRFAPRQAVLTFDDGMQNFQDVAVPILREFGLTATNYLVTSFLESQKANVRMAVRDVIRQVRGRPYPAALPGGTAVPAGVPLTRVEALALGEFDALPPEEDARRSYVETLARSCGVDLEPLERHRTWYAMTPAVVRALSDDGFPMQLHTHSHFNVVDHPDTVADEVRLCRERVEAVTGRPARHFCYPSGRWMRSVWPDLEREGVLTATTTLGGPNFPESPLLALRRVMNGEDRDQLEFEFKMSNLRWLVARVFGTAERAMPSEKRHAYRDDGATF